MDTNNLLIILITLGVFAIGFILVPYLQKNKIINNSNVEKFSDLLILANYLVKGMKPNNFYDVANKVALEVVNYVEQTMKDQDNETKKQHAMETAELLLDSLGYKITDDERKIIEVLIESAVSYLPPTHSDK